MQPDPLQQQQRSFKLDAKHKSCSLPLKVKAFVPSLNFDLLSLFPPPHRWPNKNLNLSPSLASFNLFEAVSFEASFTMAGFVQQKLGVRVFVWHQWQKFIWLKRESRWRRREEEKFLHSNDAFSFKIYFCSFNKQWKLFAFNSHEWHITPYQIWKGTCGLKLPPNDRLLL